MYGGRGGGLESQGIKKASDYDRKREGGGAV